MTPASVSWARRRSITEPNCPASVKERKQSMVNRESEFSSLDKPTMWSEAGTHRTGRNDRYPASADDSWRDRNTSAFQFSNSELLSFIDLSKP
jgi:hypothetical protein